MNCRQTAWYKEPQSERMIEMKKALALLLSVALLTGLFGGA